jgi:hypothetical protein
VIRKTLIQIKDFTALGRVGAELLRRRDFKRGSGPPQKQQPKHRFGADNVIIATICYAASCSISSRPV